jgi:hypothetical protein
MFVYICIQGGDPGFIGPETYTTLEPSLRKDSKIKDETW